MSTLLLEKMKLPDSSFGYRWCCGEGRAEMSRNLFVVVLLLLGFSSAGPGVASSTNSYVDGSFSANGVVARSAHYRHNYRTSNSVQDVRPLDSSSQYLHVNLSFLNDFERNCPGFCGEEQQYINRGACISQGCANWRIGLREGCASVCEEQKDFRDLRGCKLGCKNAIEDYYSRVQGLLGAPDPPTLVSNSLNSTSLQLSWDGSCPELPYLAFIIQRRAYLRSHQWEMIPTSPLNQSVFTVPGLKPYTEYQFRVGWILAHDLSPLFSRESSRITTLAKGLPNSPQITSIQPISNTSVSVTWVPPSQPNGPLRFYTLKLHPLPTGHAIIKEILMLHDPRGYTFSGLSPNTNYSLSLSASNDEGEGEGNVIEFSTPQTSMNSETSAGPEPRLLLQGGQDVFIQKLDFYEEPDVVLFNSTQNITAIAAHFKYKWVFIATGDNHITRKSLDGNETVKISVREGSDITVTFLSVDWLHNKLYIVGKVRRSGHWVVKRCDLGGKNLENIFSELGSEPVDFAANPFTGYLYWVSKKNIYRRAGLYKMPMISPDPRPIPVIETEGDVLGPFTMDYVNYRILVVDKKKNTVLSVTLTGDATDIRQNTQSPQFGDVLSMGMYKGIFYWTTGESIVLEEYNAAADSFYHNLYDVSKRHQPCSRLMVLHPDSQPIPVPLAPPTSPQAVFGTRQALISWRPPAVIAGLGRDAWTDWKYQVRLSDNTTLMNISETHVMLSNLEPNTTYAVQVLSYSSSGRGPLSFPFRGRTLPDSMHNMSILWTSKNGLYSTDPMGENVKLLLSPSVWNHPAGGRVSRTGSWYPVGSQLHLAATAWYDEHSMYLLLSNGTVYHYDGDNVSGPILTRARGIGYAQSIAYDYIGKKVYWSDPKKQTILRCGLKMCLDSNEEAEWLQIVTVAKEIAIDSYRAVLIWSTGHSLETARLNGLKPYTLYQAGLFSGVHITGMTLDTDNSRLFFLTRSSQGSTIYRMNYNLRPARIPEIVANFEDVSILGPIRYFQDRLLWLQDSSVSVLTDLQTKSRATLEVSSIQNVTSFQFRDMTTWKYPGGLQRSTIQVFPGSVLSWSIRVDGSWDDFIVSWQPVNNTNHGNISYSVVVSLNQKSMSWLLEDCSLRINNGAFPAFSDIEVKVIAMSYWASSKATVARVTTPAGKPSEPLNPRVFIEKLSPFYRKVYNKEDGPSVVEPLINAQVRWDAPTTPNGHILGYVVHCWKRGVKKSDCMSLCDRTRLSCDVHNLSINTTYQFTILAYTSAGTGSMSREIILDTTYDENPIPRMLITTGSKLEILDTDRNTAQLVTHGVLSPISAVYFALDRSIYWVNEGQDLIKTDLISQNRTRILSLHRQGIASNLALDWIGRKLFWASEQNETHAIFSLDLSSIEDVKDPSPKTILTSQSAITGLTVNPFKGQILWTTSKIKGITSSFVAMTNGTSPKPFLSRDGINCNCSNFSSIGEPIAFDPSGFGSVNHGVLFTSGSSIHMADENGCHCIQLTNMAAHSSSRLLSTPYKIAADHQRVYWSGGYLSASEKDGRGGVTDLVASGIRDISILTPQSQPLPEMSCLIPSQLTPEAPTLAQHSSHSLHITLPNTTLSNCSYKDLSIPAPKYKVFYGKVNENGISECTPSNVPSCHVISTSKSYLVITELSPFTTYTVFVNVTNVYAELEGLLPLACPPIMLQTAPGAPMPPNLLRIERLTPSSMRVVWRKPLKLNGEKVWYKVHWQPEKTRVSPGLGWKEVDAQPGDDWSDIASKSNENRTEFHLILSDLLPGSNYSVWVVAFSEKGDAWSVSENKTISTYPNPSNLTLMRATPYTLNFQWIPPSDNNIISHQFFYRMGWNTEWNSTEMVFNAAGRASYNFTVSNLKPKTVYGFKIRAWYRGDPETAYEWPRGSFGQFEFETQADKPGPPGIPKARGVGKSLYEVSWERSDPNGAEVELYTLECRMNREDLFTDHETIIELSPTAHTNDTTHDLVRRKRNSGGGDSGDAQKLVLNDSSSRSRYKTSHWFIVYNGTEPNWQVQGIELDAYVSFRVKALNKYGWGEYSNESMSASMKSLTLVAEPQPFGIILGAVSTAIVILAIFGSFFIFAYRQKLKEKPGLQSPTSSERREVELATLRELPTGSNFVHQSNILYAANELLLDLESAGVPQVLRTQISRTKFLGSGAFGEVYEGLVLNLPGSGSDETKVAIKTLRKGASPNEKIDFIQEAKLMTQFKHPHILQLMGICIDAGPCCLLLELMNGGDLLSYLRANRPHLGSTIVLSMVDLLKMCLDVAKGCVYLEDLHFVHRDLAARNCLVRILDSLNPEESQQLRTGEEERIVKIGDFGLSRDVYRNDYYRKDSAAPVPVRWMAPESLVDGIYTTQSDVWAFGVLVWEIMTLGNQPYPARNNPEVLNYVGRGGRLTPPAHCPQRLIDLMLQCWEFFADNRPTFKDCQVELEGIITDLQSSPENSASFPMIEPSELELQQFNNYLQPGSDSKGSYNYRSDDGGEGTELSTLTRDRSPLYPENLSKYLQIVRNHPGTFSNSAFPSLQEPDVDDGYEKPIPKKPPRNPNLSSGIKHRTNNDAVHAEIGLPPVPASYYNTSSEMFGNRNAKHTNISESRSHENSFSYPPFVESNPPSTSPLTGKSRLYFNVRKLGLLEDASNEDIVAPFRNLLASTTSEDADISDAELWGSPSRETNGFQNHEKTYSRGFDKENNEPGRQQVASLSDSGVGSAPDAHGCYGQDDDEDDDEDYDDGIPPENYDNVPPASELSNHQTDYSFTTPQSYNSNVNFGYMSNHSSSPRIDIETTPMSRYFSNNGYLYTDVNSVNGNGSLSVDSYYYDRRKPVIVSDSITPRHLRGEPLGYNSDAQNNGLPPPSILHPVSLG